MSRQDNGRPGRMAAGAPTTGLNERMSVETWMLIVATNDALDQLLERQFDQLDAAISAQGGTLKFTTAEYRSYNVTAIKARVRFVLGGRWRGLGYEHFDMDVRDKWALSTAVHDVLSAIGVVRIGVSGLQINPLWDSGADDATLTRNERDRLTPLIQSAFQRAGFKSLDAISADRDGHQQVMMLTYLPTTQEWWTAEPVGREDAASSMLLNATPVSGVARGADGPVYTVVDTERLADALTLYPTWLPPLTMKRQTVVRYTTELSDLSK